MRWLGLVGAFSNDPATAEKRSALRRKLEFESVLTTARAPSKVVVLDLSEAGLLLHSGDELTVGETFEVALPQAGPIEARVAWKRVTLYGCEFISPVSKAMISAVLLKAAPGRPLRAKG
jgi:hypothetical protein